ncbi:hypothetical protein MPSI1_001659 [Malassezia psittaci]|uniref:CAP-Gly domain-containing protein n=1 Tax=Malassezia psittaci TaxID=1821823 RepID=A0AAF0F576_9BASI|nr:hypothetical protein MPSI1_001659 [Malassezia psittaci]
MPLCQVGARLVYRGEYGTVRYLGEISGQSYEWIGVEWDRAGRGKHDGVGPDGTRYFQTCTRLAMPTHLARFECLKHLSLNATHVTWMDACALGKYMPQLESLELAKNGITRLDQPEIDAFPKLRKLNLEDNALQMASVMDALCLLPQLEHLVLSNNRIDLIQNPRPFPQLRSLALQGNCLVDWDSIQALEHIFPGSYSLSIDIPKALMLDHRQFRLEAIARLGKLACLHHTPISEAERKDAELYYISNASGNDRESDRYRTLCTIHNQEPVQPSYSQPSTLQSKMIRVGISTVHHLPNADQALCLLRSPHKVISLLRTSPLRIVQRRILNASNMSSNDARLYALLLSDNKEALIVPMEDLGYTLEFYGVQESDGVLLVIQDPDQ